MSGVGRALVPAAARPADEPLEVPAVESRAVEAELDRALWARARPATISAAVALALCAALARWAGRGDDVWSAALAVGAVQLLRGVYLFVVPPSRRARAGYFATSLLLGVALAFGAGRLLPGAEPGSSLVVALAVFGGCVLELTVSAPSFGGAAGLVVPAVGGLAAVYARVEPGAGPFPTLSILGLGAVLLRVAARSARAHAAAARLRLERDALHHALSLERARAGRALEAASAERRAKVELVAELGRGVRRPLTGVLGMTELLIGGALRTEERYFAEAAHQSGRSLLAAVETVLDLLRLESGKAALAHAPFALEAMVEDVLLAHGPAAAKKGLVLAHRVDRRLPAYLLGDVARVKQALDRLVANALRTTDAGEVEVTVAPGANPGSERFSVRDTGPGYEPYLRARLLQRAEGAAAAGLGLALVRELVERMGGAVSVESQPGVGTELAFTLNLEAGAAPRAEPAMSLVGHAVLVWTQHPLHAEQLRGWIEAMGGRYERVGATDELARQVAAGARILVIDARVAPELAGLAARHPSLRLVVFDPAGPGAGPLPAPARRLGTPLTRGRFVRALAELDARGPDDRDGLGGGGGFAGARVLVAHAEATSRTVLRGMLGRLGAVPTVVEDGGSALAAMIEARYDVALLDAELLDLDAVAVARQLRVAEAVKGASPQPLVVLATQPTEADRARYLEAGIAGVVVEPVSLAALDAGLSPLLSTPAADAAGRSGREA